MEFVPAYMLPSPIDVVKAFADNFSIMMKQAAVTLQETLYGLLIGIAIAFVIASLMDRFTIINKALYPVLVVTQTIPTIAIAPLLVLWMGFGMAPKITLVVITTFFPIAIGLLNGFQSVDEDAINLMRSMGARRLQIFRIIKLPNATASFFSGLRISAAYAVVGAVVSEWLGGFEGLGVYMTRVKKAYAFDKMFAVIVFISAISLVLMGIVVLLEKISGDEGEVPVGAVVTKSGEIVATGRNRREIGKNALYHAELEAIDNACKALGGWRLWQCELYVTLEPCPMCAGAIINSRIKRVVFGASDSKAGSFGSVVDFNNLPYNHKPEIVSGVLKDECSSLLSDFFARLREERTKNKNIDNINK